MELARFLRLTAHIPAVPLSDFHRLRIDAAIRAGLAKGLTAPISDVAVLLLAGTIYPGQMEAIREHANAAIAALATSVGAVKR